MVSGTVFEVTTESVRPLAGVRVVAWTGWDIGDASATTDVAGRYQISGLRDNHGGPIPLQALTAVKEGYSQPCRARIDQWLAGSADEVNVYVVADDVLITGGMPALLPVSGPVLSGTVFRRGSNGGDPVAGAEVAVDFTHGYTLVPGVGVRTLTDQVGRYTLCGLTQPYRVFWDEGAGDFPEGSAHVLSRRGAGAPLTRVHVDVRTVTHLDIDVN